MADPAPDARLPAGVEVSALVRLVEQAGGFAAVLNKGEVRAGTILIVLSHRGEPQRAFERMPVPSGERRWTLARVEDPDDSAAFAAWLDRRKAQDPDMWIVELDIAQGERFIPG